MRVRATAEAFADPHRSTYRLLRLPALFAALAVGCGSAPEKVAHPEPASPKPAATSAPEPEPLKTAEPKPAPASPPPAPSPPPASSYAPAVTCDVRGTPLMTKGVSLWSEPQGTSAAAAFAGQPVSLIANGFPASASSGRIRVRTSGGLRIDGFLDPVDLPIYTGSEVAVVPGHVWIAQGQKVTFTGASNGLSIEAAIAGPVTQTFRVTAPCASFMLDKRPRVPWDVPGNGRGYLPQKGTLELRDQPGGAVVQTLRSEPASPILLWSTETQGGYVHVLYHEDLVIDAWVAAADLNPLKQGETMDRLAPPSSVVGGARLSISGQPTVVRAQKDVPLRLSPQEAAKPVGAIETGGEVYLIQTVLGWTSVLPRALNVLPPGERSFWVPSSEVGTAAK